jgi:hypothetical protein
MQSYDIVKKSNPDNGLAKKRSQQNYASKFGRNFIGYAF